MSGSTAATHNRRDAPVLHRAAWVVPVAAPPVPDGAVLTANGTIVAVGPVRSLKATAPAGTRLIDHDRAALMPALVNAHTHLELTPLAGQIPLPQAGFASWLNALIAARTALTDKAVEAGIAEGLRLLTAAGCTLCGDVSNTGRAVSPTHRRLSPSPGGRPEGRLPGHGVGDAVNRHSLAPHPVRHLFMELLGFNVNSLNEALGDDGSDGLQESAAGDSLFSLAAHAPYSVSAALIRETRSWCRKHRRPFSIHAAEHPEESRFLSDGTGFCRDLLESLGRWVPSWTPPGESPIRYLHNLGILDAGTLLVHAVHLTSSDWETVAESGCTVCFCPRSNHFLGAGKPDLNEALRRGVPAALGTDSLASNIDLDLFAEAAFVLDRYSGVPAESVLSMITLGGAHALGRGGLYGSIEPGKGANLLSVALPTSVSRPSSVFQLAETLIRQGKEGAWRWAHRSHMA